MRNLVLVLGDQLDPSSSAFDDFDKSQDGVWMAEVSDESTHVPSHKARTALFLSAMRHFRVALERRGVAVHYSELDDDTNTHRLDSQLQRAVKTLRPQRLVMVEPGEYRVRELLFRAASRLGLELEIRSDRHFLCSHDEFEAHAEGRKQLRLEYFYREWRRKFDVLMEDGKPIGGKWNYDSENRGTFSKAGPSELPAPKRFRPDTITKQVLELVSESFPDNPGSLDRFDWPVTSRHAKAALKDFIQHRLCHFGDYQDAMWTEQPYLYHSRISTALNLKLLNPRDAIQAAQQAYYDGDAPLNAVEGFIRQILGWREYVRGIYWMYMPEYLDRNALNASAKLPEFYWTGDTDMHCLQQAIRQTLEHGYAHHIQRLMVTGLFALLLGVEPQQVHQWYLGIYVDAVEWVELPNTLGMSQFADGGVMASKPYAATGKYIQRMSNYCDGCKFKPAEATGEAACPFTTLYWDFLDRHQDVLASNQRMSLQVKNLERKPASDLTQIRLQADKIRKQFQ